MSSKSVGSHEAQHAYDGAAEHQQRRVDLVALQDQQHGHRDRRRIEVEDRSLGHTEAAGQKQPDRDWRQAHLDRAAPGPGLEPLPRATGEVGQQPRRAEEGDQHHQRGRDGLLLRTRR